MHQSEDEARKAVLESRNHLDQMVYQVEKLIKENGDKLPEADKKEAEEALVGAKKALEGQDAEAIKSALETLTTKSHKLAESIYKSTPPSSDPGANSGTSGQSEKPKDETVIDAEVV